VLRIILSPNVGVGAGAPYLNELFSAVAVLFNGSVLLFKPRSTNASDIFVLL